MEDKIEENKIEEFVGNKEGKMPVEEKEVIKIRKDNIIKFLKTKYNWITYIFLAIIVWLAVRIRTRNLPILKDITTGTWTLGPDLDPFLFLRWAKYIVEHGHLYAIDTMRYVPLGYKTSGELLLTPYLIVWFHKIAVFFGSESITHSAVLHPVFMFAFTVIAFFLFSRKIFLESEGALKANIIALISSFFLSVLPIFLPRTIAGIPEKESSAFLFMFLAFYLFLSAWKSKQLKNGIILAILAGASTAGMALIWGGYAFIFYTLFLTILIAFILGVFVSSIYILNIIQLSFVAILGLTVICLFGYKNKLGLLISFLILAFAVGGWRFSSVNNNSTNFESSIGEEVELVGYVDNEPELDGTSQRFVFKSDDNRILVTHDRELVRSLTAFPNIKAILITFRHKSSTRVRMKVVGWYISNNVITIFGDSNKLLINLEASSLKIFPV